jgi:hypothetical protein
LVIWLMDTPYPMYNKWIPLSKTIDITITAIIIKECFGVSVSLYLKHPPKKKQEL